MGEKMNTTTTLLLLRLDYYDEFVTRWMFSGSDW